MWSQLAAIALVELRSNDRVINSIVFSFFLYVFFSSFIEKFDSFGPLSKELYRDCGALAFYKYPLCCF